MVTINKNIFEFFLSTALGCTKFLRFHLLINNTFSKTESVLLKEIKKKLWSLSNRVFNVWQKKHSEVWLLLKDFKLSKGYSSWASTLVKTISIEENLCQGISKTGVYRGYLKCSIRDTNDQLEKII